MAGGGKRAKEAKEAKAAKLAKVAEEKRMEAAMEAERQAERQAREVERQAREVAAQEVEEADAVKKKDKVDALKMSDQEEADMYAWVEKNECLYNKNHKDHLKKEYKFELWQAQAVVMALTCADGGYKFSAIFSQHIFVQNLEQ